MPVFDLNYVYQLSDFDTSGSNQAVPNEQGAQAAGTPPFNLAIDANAGPLQIDVSDTDSGFDEINNSGQVLQSAVTIDGVTYPAGSSVIVNYELSTDDGFLGYSITIGGSNSGNNTTTAFVTNGPMVPGQTYTFTSEGNIGRGSRDYDQFACFVRGTQIATYDGSIAVEDLTIGEDVLTHDGRVTTVRGVLHRRLSAAQLREHPQLFPVRIVAGALGGALPRRDLLVSPQHRMLVSSVVARRMFAAQEVLVAAKKLLPLPGVIVDETLEEVEYYHVVLDRHEVLLAEGAPSESFFCGEEAIAGLTPKQRLELLAIFPELAEARRAPKAALPIPEGRLQKKLISVHAARGLRVFK